MASPQPARLAAEVLSHRAVALILAALSGALASLALPSFYILPALLVAIPVLLWLITESPSYKSAFWRGWWFGFAHLASSLYWIGNAVTNESVDQPWAWPFAVAALPACLAIFIGAAAVTTRFLVTRRWWAIPALAVAWTAAELLRGILFTGFPWNLIGTVWAGFDAPPQAAWLFGTYGLSLMTMLIAASPYALLRAGVRTVRGWGVVGAGLILLAALWGYGLWRLDANPQMFHPDVKLRIVQANIPQDEKWSRLLRDDNFLTHLRLSGDDAKDVTVFIWPETALPYFIADEPSRQNLIGRFLPEGSVLITGAPRVERKNGMATALWNSLFVLGSDGRIHGQYDKMHLVPFGEYLPLRSVLGLIGLDKVVFGALDYSAGLERPALEAGEAPPFWPLICYEIIFPGQVDGSGERPEWLVNVTNDAWYGDTIGPRQHLMAAKLRAIEEGLPVARAAGSGISAVFDAQGRMVHSLPFDRRGTVDSYLPVAGTPGPFVYNSNGIVMVMMLVLLLTCRRWHTSRK